MPSGSRKSPPVQLLLADAQLEQSNLPAALEAAGIAVTCAAQLGAREWLQKGDFQVVVAESGQAAEDLLELAASQSEPPAVILLDGFGTIHDAVESIRRGAFDYLSKPAPEEQILASVKRALSQQRLLQENRRLRENLGELYSLSNLQTRDQRMLEVFETVRSVADTRATVLIEGESGTGKTMLARAIHLNSERAKEPFVVVHCGAVPESLLESELFGHVRGAFTGAVRDRIGRFEAADGGTIFLDEIATAPLELQVKLLRIIETKQFERVGDEQTREVDVRVLAAGNRTLTMEVSEGRFREDLYYRLNVVSIQLPPLRERPTDIPLLAQYFLGRANAEHGRQIEEFSSNAMTALLRHAWLGNVRELQNRIERGVLLARGPHMEAADLDLADSRVQTAGSQMGDHLPTKLGPLKEALEGPERSIIERALELNGGNRTRTAQLLSIDRSTLFNKMKKYDLLDSQSKSA